MRAAASSGASSWPPERGGGDPDKAAYRIVREDPESAAAKESWLEHQKFEWARNQAERERRNRLLKAGTEPLQEPHRPFEPNDADIKRDWLRRQRLQHQERQRDAHYQRAPASSTEAPLVDAALLSTPSERELYLRSLQEERTHSLRERRRMSNDAARRPSLGNAHAPEHSVLYSLERLHCHDAGDEEAEAGGYGFNYLDDGRQLASDCSAKHGRFIDDQLSTTSGGETSTSAAERYESESLEELEQLEALRLAQLQAASAQQQQHGQRGRGPSGGASAGLRSPRSSRPISAPHHRIAQFAGVLPPAPAARSRGSGAHGGAHETPWGDGDGGDGVRSEADKMKMMADHGVAESFDGIGGLIGPTDSEDDDDDEHDRHPCARRPPLSSLGESPPWLRTSSPTSLGSRNSSVLRLEDITILKSR